MRKIIFSFKNILCFWMLVSLLLSFLRKKSCIFTYIMEVLHICFPFANVFNSKDKAKITLDLSVPVIQITTIICFMYIPLAFLYVFVYSIYVLIEITSCVWEEEVHKLYQMVCLVIQLLFLISWEDLSKLVHIDLPHAF